MSPRDALMRFFRFGGFVGPSNRSSLAFLIFFLLVLAGCIRPSRMPIPTGLEVQRGKIKVPNEYTGELIRIGLAVDLDEIDVSCPGPLEVFFEDSHKERWPGSSFKVEVKDHRLVVQGKNVGRTVRMLPLYAGDYVEMKNQYRGFVVLKLSESNKITVINELTEDDYLKGVLPREIIDDWPAESLKAQAVASRTYLTSHMGKHRKEGFDLCAKVHCQVYGGVKSEKQSCSAAVDATRHIVMVYRGKPILAYFHNSCGGSTEQVQKVWGYDDKLYLPARKCRYCRNSPRFHWELDLKNEEILNALKKERSIKGNSLTRIVVERKSPSGRSQIVSVQTESGTYNFLGDAFRMAVSPWILRSTLWTSLKKTDGGYHFAGKGWGHGVGMCQWGAKGQAEVGRNFKEILRFYYPHVSFVK